MADERDLTRTIGVLRRDVAMRPEWRDAVLRDIETLPRPGSAPLKDASTTERRRWTLRPSMAIAAGLVCAAVGGGITLGVQTAFRPRTATVPPAVAGAVAAVRHAPPVRFVLVAPSASRVAIVGDFNGWIPTATPMRRSGAGLWSVDLPLAAGRHAYSFVVDGVLVADPNALDSADDDYGVPSSVVLVSDPHRT